MISLRRRLWLGYGGLLLVLLVVSAMSALVLTRYSRALERVFRENYDSARYCGEMDESLDRLDARAQRLIWEEEAARQNDVQAQEARFDLNLQRQLTNCTLPGELDQTRHLQDLWGRFKARYQQFDAESADRPALYRQDLLPRLQEMKRVAQQIAEMNMNNMVSVDGQAKRMLVDVRTVLLVIAITGTLMATIVVWTAGAAILHPLRAFTRSARQIEAGDLDLSLTVRSRDEIGQLATAFNSMAARLREFRRLDHDRLIRTQQTTQLAIDSLPDAVFVIGPGDHVEISNRTARTHFGIDPGATVSQLRLKWLTSLYDSIKRNHQPIEPQGYEGAVQLFENGEERFLLPRAVPMLGQNQELIGVTVILVDVTGLRRADEAKSSVISIVSHELRTPLTGVRMALSLLAGDKFGTVLPKQQRLLTAAREDSDRLYRIIENLLNISRIEAGAQFQFQRITPTDIVSHALDPLRSAFAERNLRVEVSIPGGVPEVRADPMSIGSALSNLLSNALKFTPPGGVVRVASEAEGDSVSFTVADNGPGIPEVYRDRIFEKFFRIPRESGPNGAGLGLTIAKEIIEAHGGAIDFDCPGTGGTIFHFRLPVDPNHAAAPVTG